MVKSLCQIVRYDWFNGDGLKYRSGATQVYKGKIGLCVQCLDSRVRLLTCTSLFFCTYGFAGVPPWPPVVSSAGAKGSLHILSDPSPLFHDFIWRSLRRNAHLWHERSSSKCFAQGAVDLDPEVLLVEASLEQSLGMSPCSCILWMRPILGMSPCWCILGNCPMLGLSPCWCMLGMCPTKGCAHVFMYFRDAQGWRLFPY